MGNFIGVYCSTNLLCGANYVPHITHCLIVCNDIYIVLLPLSNQASQMTEAIISISYN
jgi:hypothetical protein